MKKQFRTLGYVLSLALGMSMLTGCGKKVDGVDQESMIDKYAAYCDLPEYKGLEYEETKSTVTDADVKLPEYNDAFIASYTDATTVLEYEDSVRKDLVEQYEKSDKSANESAVMQVLVEKTTYNEYPQKEMQDLIDQSIAQQEKAASQYGYSLGDYVTARYGFQSEDDFREYVQGLAEDYMKEKIAVCAVAKDAGITVTKEEVDDYKKTVMDYYGYDSSTLEENYSSEDLVYYALAQKVVDYLLENGKGVEATATDATVETPAATDSNASSTDAE